MKNDNKRSIIIVVAILALVLILFAFIRGCDKKEKNVEKKKPNNDIIEKITEDNDIEEVEEYNLPTETVKVTPAVAKAKEEQILTLTLNGDDTVYVDYNTTYTEEGAFASDTVDGTITGNVVRKVYAITTDVNGGEVRTLVDDVDTTIGGAVYEIEYTVTNSKGDSKTIIRKVVINDVKVTVFALNGDREVTVELGNSFIDDGVTGLEIVNDVVVGTINPEIKYYLVDDVTGAETEVSDITDIGVYTVRYTGINSDGNEYNVNRRVEVVDTTAPTIGVEDTYTLKVNEDFDLDDIYTMVTDNDANFDPTTGVTYTVLDAAGDDITAIGIDNSMAGEYTINITAVDPTGNTSTKTVELSIVEFTPTVTATRTWNGRDWTFEFTDVTDATSYELYYYSRTYNNNQGGWKPIENNTFHSGNGNPEILVVDELGNEYTEYFENL